MDKKNGVLYLIPCPIGDTPPMDVLPMRIKKIIENTDHYIVEHEKSARQFIKSVVPSKSQPDLHFSLINKFTQEQDIPNMLDPIFLGNDIGVISDAGCPGIADPGASIVIQAHLKGIRVIPLVGPSSIYLAMMSSGLNGQNFAFNGYLPIDKRDRKTEILRLEKLSSDKNQTQIFIETPYRNNQMLESLTSILNHDTLLSVACDITLPSEFIKTASIKSWRKIKVDLHKRPTIFSILK